MGETALIRRPAVIWWTGGIVIAGVLARSWWSILSLPLGDSHDGRINARLGLQVRNLFDDGVFGSGLASSLEPFSTTPYAHHPPLLNYLQAGVRLVAGEGATQLHIIGFVAGLLTVAGLLWLAYELGIRPIVAVAAAAVVAATPMFWIYARLGIGMSLVLAYFALRARSERTDVARWQLVTAGVVLALSSWVGAAIVVLTGLMDIRSRERRAEGVSLLGGGLGVVAAVGLWAILVSAPGELTDHASSRVSLPVPFGEFVEQLRWFYETLFPTWFRWLYVVFLAAALIAPRTRRVAGPWLVAMGLWSIALLEAVHVHDYWTYPLLGPTALGIMVLVEWLVDRGVPTAALVSPLVIAAILVANATLTTGYREAYFEAPADAGVLLLNESLPPDQVVAWAVGVELPRWISYYWDVPVGIVGPDSVGAVDPDHLVFMRADRIPSWVPSGIEAEAGVGRYVLVRAGQLQQR